MSNAVYLKYGRILYTIAILAIGITHIVTRNFPQGLLAIPATVPMRLVLVYITGVLLAVASILILIEKFTKCGAYIACAVWLILLLVFHLPQVIQHSDDPTKWTPAFEVAALLSGALILINLEVVARYVFASALVVFTVQHYKYLLFITTLIPLWMPAHLVLAYLVLAAFFLASVSLIINVSVKLSSQLLALMFLLWFLTLHLPRVIANLHTETEWTSMFIVLAMAGISLLITSNTPESNKVST